MSQRGEHSRINMNRISNFSAVHGPIHTILRERALEITRRLRMAGGWRKQLLKKAKAAGSRMIRQPILYGLSVPLRRNQVAQ